jgi:adenylylsulfate kinase-like enzyme
MAKIYWFTGKSGVGKTVLAKKLVEFLSTDKRNWRSKVFHIDDVDFPNSDDITANIKNTQLITEFIYKNGCDIVVSINSPNRLLRNEFKKKIGNDIEELYIYNSKKELKSKKVEYYETPEDNFFGLDTANKNPVQSFYEILYYLKSK